MTEMPESSRPRLQRLARRLATGLFLDIWPKWATGSLLAAGVGALICRLFFPRAAPALPWLWFAPVAITIPVLILCYRHAYKPSDVVALADWLSGGRGTLLTLYETDDLAWSGSSWAENAPEFALPRLRPWRRLAPVSAAALFLMAALLLPQRTHAQAGNAILAEEIASELSAIVAELKQQDLIAPDEGKQLEEEIERIRRGARERVDSSSWEAADALREKVTAGLSDKQDAVKWAEEALARYAAAASDPTGEPNAEAASAELMKALEKLAQQGLLANAPPDLQRLLESGKLPTDSTSVRELTALMAKYLSETGARCELAAGAGKPFGRFDPTEFPVNSSRVPRDGDGDPGRGGVNRGRGDAPLTWGKETLPFDRFKAEPLPPGAARSPDDWAPLVELPGTPRESPTLSTRTAARQHAAAPGNSAWRRTLAPRHQNAVKKYFEK